MNIARITEKLGLILERKLTVPELRKVIKPELEEIERKRVESAKKCMHADKLIPQYIMRSKLYPSKVVLDLKLQCIAFFEE